MTSDGPAVERLRDYLRTLKPEARAMLVTELERGVLGGGEAARNNLILEELRRTLRAAERPSAGAKDIAQLFFAPVEPFLIEEAGDHKRVGRIARAALDPIWEWIGRDLMPAEASALGEDIDRVSLDNDRVKIEQLVHVFQDCAVERMWEAVAAVAGDEKARRRLAVQIGTPRALDDVAAIAGIVSSREVFADLSRRLPTNLRAFEREHIDMVKSVLDAATAPKGPSAGAGRSDIFLHGLVLTMSRLAAPWQLIRIATRAAESDAAARIAETPYAVAVTVVIGEIECMVSDLHTALKARRPVTLLLKNIHDTARGLRTEIDLSGDSAWSRQLTAIRTEVSNVLKAEIDSAPGRIRRLLRPRPAKEIAPGSVLDALDVAEGEALVEFVGACRTYAHELAVNEATVRSYSELQQYLESGTKLLLDTLRQAGDADRPFRQSQMDAAIRFCKVVFGADYAGLLAKAAEIAVQTAAAERRQARA